MKIDLNYELSDAHCHFGASSLIDVTVDENKLRSHISLNGLQNILVFADDKDYINTNYTLSKVLPRLNDAYGLVRVQLREFKFNTILRFFKSNAFLGVKFHPAFDRIPIINKKFDILFKWLENNNKLVLIHCGRWREVTNYSFAFQRAEEYPELTFILAHMGGNVLENSMNSIELAKLYPNVYLDTSNCRIPFVIEKAVKRMGPDRILFGSDFPWGSCLSNFFVIYESDISESSKKKIFHNNLKNIIKKHK